MLAFLCVFFPGERTTELKHCVCTCMKRHTMVVSWIDPKLLIKMFTRSSTGIPKKISKLINKTSILPNTSIRTTVVHFLTNYYG